MSELVVDQYGAFLGVKEGCFLLRDKSGKSVQIPPVKLEHISIRVPGVCISAAALALAAKYGIDLTIYSRGKPASKVIHATMGGGAFTKQAQLSAVGTRKGLEISRAFVRGKLHNQRMVVYQRGKEARARGRSCGDSILSEAEAIRRLIERLDEAKTVDEIRAYEAQGALCYWRAVALLLPKEIGFEGREHRNPPDPFNRALNIGYGILRSTVWSAVLAANLDPYIGYLHVPHGRHMCLVSDLMEEFRPCVADRPLIALALNKPDDILKVDSERGRSVIEAVRKALNAHNRLLEKAIFEQARRLASYLRGNIPEYKPYKLRW